MESDGALPSDSFGSFLNLGGGSNLLWDKEGRDELPEGRGWRERDDPAVSS